ATAVSAVEVTFEKDVRPILKAHCTHCHGEEEKPDAGLDLRLRRFMDKVLDGDVRVVVPGKPADSGMIKMIRSGKMPKKGKKMPEADLAILERWIAEGAKTTRPEPESLAPGAVITDEERAFWSFKPIVSKAPPELQDAGRVRTPIDQFVLAQLRSHGLDFAPDAEKRTLLRRVTMDLTGLPPAPEEVDAFVADASPDAYEKVVDRLLGSSAYGERWARHWLDVAGYADSNGFAEADSLRPHAWRYRDYVIRSFNADKPWNEFIVEQLAGDELAGVTQDDTQQALADGAKRDQLIATAFLRMAPDGTGDGVPDPNLARNQVIAEEIKVVTTSLLGLTAGCAQCHDHRYDPVTQADYYRFRAIFEPAFDWQKWRAPAQRLYSLYTPEERAKAAEIEKQAQALDAESRAMSKKFLDEIFEKEIIKLPEPERAPYRAARGKEEKDRSEAEKALIKKYPSALALYSLDLYDPALQKKVADKAAEAAKLRETKPAEGFVMALTEVKGAVPETKLFHRGDHDQPKQTLTPGELGVLSSPQIEPFKPASVSSGSSGRRLAYARWLTGGQHPLVARVLVNRFWMHHFGSGIVNTPGDFGVQGGRPTHPELLDWLASRFMESGWKLKPLHRLMVLSTAYRQSSRSDLSIKADPDNRFYGRFRLHRLGAEALRDSLLFVAGTLNRSSFGPAVKIARDPGGRIVVGQEQLNVNGDVTGVTSLGQDDFRRSIYVQVRRKTPLTVLDAFDAPVMTPNCEARNCTTVAPQSLLLMNDTFVLSTARALAERLRKERPGDARGQVIHAWRLLFGAEPQQDDLMRSLSWLAEQAETVRVYRQAHPPAKDAPAADPGLDALASLCQVLCSSNRFLYVE
ncbi:MAG TPA: PSD1 and planctomycete cytochrome C domain-containing protein, partial [Verrucomicrobiales bacterium]|nr:PSD1 and planctomycete cytochrome C domain-containing protein [Verrucomicrobiales bacterium]